MARNEEGGMMLAKIERMLKEQILRLDRIPELNLNDVNALHSMARTLMAIKKFRVEYKNALDGVTKPQVLRSIKGLSEEELVNCASDQPDDDAEEETE